MLKIKLMRRFFSSIHGQKTPTFECVIGLEIHAQIASESKLFSRSGTQFAAPINSQVSFFDASLPGTLPVLNRRCVEAAIITAHSLNCHINKESKFDRKHYFYADMPAGYQITQSRKPLAEGGHFQYLSKEKHGKGKSVNYVEKIARIIQIQLEQDSGKSLHDMEEHASYIDLNRCGIGLMEIVTEPDFYHAEDAAGFVKELQMTLQRLGTCYGRMDEGCLRVDASVSVRRPGEKLGTRREVKNINSVRNVVKAIEFERQDQISIICNGGIIENETRMFDMETGKTLSMRDKEKVHDYRFIPEPNLPPLRIDKLPINSIDSLKEDTNNIIFLNNLIKDLPLLPHEERESLMKDHNLPLSKTIMLVNDMSMLKLFKDLLKEVNINVKRTVNFLLNELTAYLNDTNCDFQDSNILTSHIHEILQLLECSKISLSMAKLILPKINGSPDKKVVEIVEEMNWFLITDEIELEKICIEAMNALPKSVTAFKAGKRNGLKSIIKYIYNKTDGNIDGKKMTEILTQKLIDT